MKEELTNQKIIYCTQEHQIDLCKTCLRNIKNYEVTDKSPKLLSTIDYTPGLIPSPHCYGYRNYPELWKE